MVPNPESYDISSAVVQSIQSTQVQAEKNSLVRSLLQFDFAPVISDVNKVLRTANRGDFAVARAASISAKRCVINFIFKHKDKSLYMFTDLIAEYAEERSLYLPSLSEPVFKCNRMLTDLNELNAVCSGLQIYLGEIKAAEEVILRR